MSKLKKSGFHPKKATQQTITEYCHNSTVAGLSYISDTSAYVLDRLLWLIAVIVFASLAIYWSLQAYFDWQDEPVITTVKTTGLPITELDYPAITICSQGWISSVTKKAMEYQFISYVESTGKDVHELTEQELEEIRNSYLNDTYPGAKSSPVSLIQSLGSSGKTSPDKVISAEIVVNNGIDSCGFMEVNSVYCPSGWSPTPIRHYDPNRKEGYYCFKNAGLSYGNIDLCPAEGGHRIWLPGNEVQYDLLKLLKGSDSLFANENVMPNSSNQYFWLGVEEIEEVKPSPVQWDKWDYPDPDECLSRYILSFPMFSQGGQWNGTDYVVTTFEECQHICEIQITYTPYGVEPGCDGIIVDELDPSKCWVMMSSYDFDYFWSLVSPEIGNCGYNTNDYCGWCNNTYQLKYWNLTEREAPGKYYWQFKGIPYLNASYYIGVENASNSELHYMDLASFNNYFNLSGDNIIQYADEALEYLYDLNQVELESFESFQWSLRILEDEITGECGSGVVNCSYYHYLNQTTVKRKKRSVNSDWLSFSYSKAFPYADNTGIRERGNGCWWAKYLNEGSLVSNLIDCQYTKLNNLCMKEASICTDEDVFEGSGSSQNEGSGFRRRRSNEDEPEIVSDVDPDNPLEMIFNPEKQGDREALLVEAKKEYQDNYGNMDMEKGYNSLFEILWYTQVPCFDVANVTSSRQHEHAMIKSCSWKGVKIPCSKVFTASPTDRGMCCTFNVQAAEEMFKSGEYQTIIKKMQSRDEAKAFDLLETWPELKHDLKKFIPEAGVSKGLHLMLDSHSDLLSGSSISDDFQGFIAVVNDNKQFPITSQKSVLIRPGHHNLVSIKAQKVSAKRDIKGYSPDKRYCYFHDENEMKSHNNYSQSNCKLECKVRQVLSVLSEQGKKLCIPWFFPIVETEYPMCDPWEAQAFQEEMKDIGDAECNKCYPDCDTTEFGASASAAPFRRCDYKNVDMSPLCTIETNSVPYPPKWGRSVLEEYSATRKGMVPSYVNNKVITNRRKNINDADRRIEGQKGKELFTATNQDDQEYDAYEKDIATVTFFFESSNAFEFLRQSKTSWIDYISQVGGLLGLCLGFSFISAVEIFYWFTFKWYQNLAQLKKPKTT